VTIQILLVGFAVSAFICIPDWPYFNRNPLKWQTPVIPPTISAIPNAPVEAEPEVLEAEAPIVEQSVKRKRRVKDH